VAAEGEAQQFQEVLVPLVATTLRHHRGMTVQPVSVAENLPEEEEEEEVGRVVKATPQMVKVVMEEMAQTTAPISATTSV
jgi:hypothetical protein